MLNAKNVKRKETSYLETKSLFLSSFPNSERVPFWILYLASRLKQKLIEFKAYYEDGVFCGFTYIIKQKDFVFVLYFAINDKLRSRGYGSKILSLIAEKEKHNNMFLAIESVRVKSENSEYRLKRQGFYFKNGYCDTGFCFKEKENLFDILYKGEPLPESQYQDIFEKVSRGLWQKIKKDSALQDKGL